MTWRQLPCSSLENSAGIGDPIAMAALHRGSSARRSCLEKFDMLNRDITFRCNICDCVNEMAIERLRREEPSCKDCGSTVRMRSIIQILTTELFGESLPISEIPARGRNIHGIGMSCWDGYASRLASPLDFRNTYYHREPRLDITDIPESLVGTFDFITSSDVFEHVAPPVQRAFVNARRLLRPGGVFVFSVPAVLPGGGSARRSSIFPICMIIKFRDQVPIVSSSTSPGRELSKPSTI